MYDHTMLTLLIETCTERGIVAIIEDDHCCYMAGLPFGLHNSRYLVPKIDEGLQSLKKKPKELDLIVVGVGPGSYTGIRVGAVVAKSMSYTCQVPLVGVSTLEGFIPDTTCSFAAIIDAKMAGIYFLKGKKENDNITYTSQPTVCKLEELMDHLNDVTILVSPHSNSLRKKVEGACPMASWSWQETAPNPIHLFKRAKEKFEKGEYSTDGSLDLLYLRE